MVHSFVCIEDNGYLKCMLQGICQPIANHLLVFEIFVKLKMRDIMD